MKVLFISELMTGRDSGAKVSTWFHAEIINSIVDELDVVCLYPYTDIKETEKDKFRKFHNVFFLKSFSNKIEKISNILFLNGWCMNGKIRKQIIKIVGEYQYDVIFIDDSVMGKLAKKLKQYFPQIKLISYYHDVKAELAVKWLKENGVKTLPYNLGLIINEKINQKHVDVNLVLNKRESNLFEKYYRKTPEGLLPVGVPDIEKEYTLEKNDDSENVCNLLFVGAYYYPNVKGIKWFIINVLKKLDKKKYHLTIIGSGMEYILHEIEPLENLTIKGWVDNLADEYMHADIVVEPLFEGGGMKIKTAEALQFGKCIVGTKESFEGYEEYFGSDVKDIYLFCCNSQESFIAVIQKLSDRIHSRNMIPEVRKIYLDHFSLESNKNIIQKSIYGN